MVLRSSPWESRTSLTNKGHFASRGRGGRNRHVETRAFVFVIGAVKDPASASLELDALHGGCVCDLPHCVVVSDDAQSACCCWAD